MYLLQVTRLTDERSPLVACLAHQERTQRGRVGAADGALTGDMQADCCLPCADKMLAELAQRTVDNIARQ